MATVQLFTLSFACPCCGGAPWRSIFMRGGHWVCDYDEGNLRRFAGWWTPHSAVCFFWAKPVYLILLCWSRFVYMSWISNAGSISGNLLHMQCVITVSSYPQNDLLIFGLWIFMTEVTLLKHTFWKQSVLFSSEPYLFEGCGLPSTYSLVALPKLRELRRNVQVDLLKWSIYVCNFTRLLLSL